LPLAGMIPRYRDFAAARAQRGVYQRPRKKAPHPHRVACRCWRLATHPPGHWRLRHNPMRATVRFPCFPGSTAPAPH